MTSNQRTHIALIGEQPIPILLPARHLNANRTILVHTGRSVRVADRLAKLIPNSQPLQTPPYALNEIVGLIEESLPKEGQLIFNLTGGTKIMVLGAYTVAQERQADFLYLQSEGLQSILRQYALHNDLYTLESERPIPACITIDDYLRAYLPGYTTVGFSTNKNGKLNQGGKFEKTVYDALHNQVDEVLAGVKPAGVDDQIEMDLVIRCGNQIGIAELKDASPRGEGPKRGIDQLSTMASREYLGIYTQRFLITSRKMDKRIHTLAKEKDVTIIELTGYRQDRPLQISDSVKLYQSIKNKLIGE